MPDPAIVVEAALFRAAQGQPQENRSRTGARTTESWIPAAGPYLLREMRLRVLQQDHPPNGAGHQMNDFRYYRCSGSDGAVVRSGSNHKHVAALYLLDQEVLHCGSIEVAGIVTEQACEMAPLHLRAPENCAALSRCRWNSAQRPFRGVGHRRDAPLRRGFRPDLRLCPHSGFVPPLV